MTKSGFSAFVKVCVAVMPFHTSTLYPSSSSSSSSSSHRTNPHPHLIILIYPRYRHPFLLPLFSIRILHLHPILQLLLFYLTPFSLTPLTTPITTPLMSHRVLLHISPLFSHFSNNRFHTHLKTTLSSAISYYSFSIYHSKPILLILPVILLHL